VSSSRRTLGDVADAGRERQTCRRDLRVGGHARRARAALATSQTPPPSGRPSTTTKTSVGQCSRAVARFGDVADAGRERRRSRAPSRRPDTRADRAVLRQSQTPADGDRRRRRRTVGPTLRRPRRRRADVPARLRPARALPGSSDESTPPSATSREKRRGHVALDPAGLGDVADAADAHVARPRKRSDVQHDVGAPFEPPWSHAPSSRRGCCRRSAAARSTSPSPAGCRRGSCR
jgi:hypothetical protein